MVGVARQRAVRDAVVGVTPDEAAIEALVADLKEARKAKTRATIAKDEAEAEAQALAEILVSKQEAVAASEAESAGALERAAEVMELEEQASIEVTQLEEAITAAAELAEEEADKEAAEKEAAEKEAAKEAAEKGEDGEGEAAKDIEGEEEVSIAPPKQKVAEVEAAKEDALEEEDSVPTDLRMALADAVSRQKKASREREDLEMLVVEAAQDVLDAKETALEAEREVQAAMEAATAAFEQELNAEQAVDAAEAALAEAKALSAAIEEAALDLGRAVRSEEAADGIAEIEAAAEQEKAEKEAAEKGTAEKAAEEEGEAMVEVPAAAELVATEVVEEPAEEEKPPIPREPSELELWFKRNRSALTNVVLAAAVISALYFGGGAMQNLLQETGMGMASTAGEWVPWLNTLQPGADAAAGAAAGHAPAAGVSLADLLILLLASCVAVPLITKLPGGSPVIGYLLAGLLVGPHMMGIVTNVHAIEQVGEIGVVFLLFNIGLELSIERLNSMRKFVFGLGLAQVVATTAAICGVCVAIGGLTTPQGIVIGGALALSSTAVVLQVLNERGESQSRHGRAAFSVLLLQDLAVVVLLMLIPLLAPSDSGSSLATIARALAFAGVKAILSMVAIVAAGRVLLRPVYKRIADEDNQDLFASVTLLVALGTSVATQTAGLSMALGAFLAGLLVAETEYHLQVEADIQPYRGILLGLFFMSVGMSMNPVVFTSNPMQVLGMLAALVLGKLAIIIATGKIFGLTVLQGLQTGMLLGPGGEFAFVAFGEAVTVGIMTQQLSSTLFLVVALSMAVTPYLAQIGAMIASKTSSQSTASMTVSESDVDGMSGHVIIAGYGRVGKLIGGVLSEQNIPYIALDVRSERIGSGRKKGLPIFFGDAGSPQVLKSIGAERAAGAVITLDTPGSNYRAVWAMRKNFPNLKIYVRAHDVEHGRQLEKAGATAVVPETLEPSLQLAAAILSEIKLPADDIAASIDKFRRLHLADLADFDGSEEGNGDVAAGVKKGGKDGGSDPAMATAIIE